MAGQLGEGGLAFVNALEQGADGRDLNYLVGLPGIVVEQVACRPMGVQGLDEGVVGTSAALPAGRSDQWRDFASLIVAASFVGCALYTELRARTERPAAVYLEHMLRREMGIDEGLSDDLDRMIESVVGALMHVLPR